MVTKNNIGTYRVKSDFRIIGRLFDARNTERQIGYVVYFEKSKRLTYTTFDMVDRMLSVYKVSNMVSNIKQSDQEGKEGEACKAHQTYQTLECTDCDIALLPRYIINKNIQTIDKSVSLYILGVLKKESDITGYRVITNAGKVLDFTSKDVFQYMKRGNLVLNASILNEEIVIRNFK